MPRVEFGEAVTSLEKVDLESAVTAALPGVPDGVVGDRLRAAFGDFLAKRFAGGAAALRRVHDWRRSLVDRGDTLAEASSQEPGPYDDQTVGEAAEHSAPSDLGRLLYHLARTFQLRAGIELGTNIGISAAYLATGMALNGAGRLVTLEASGPRLEVARQVLGDLELDNVDTVQGLFSDTLLPALETHGPVDFAFLDGHHQYEPTLRYFDILCGHRRPGAVFLLDDIRWSEGMLQAWEEISTDDRVDVAVDLSRVGLLVLRQ